VIKSSSYTELLFGVSLSLPSHTEIAELTVTPLGKTFISMGIYESTVFHGRLSEMRNIE